MTKLLVPRSLNPEAQTRFDKLSHTHRKEHVQWINEAKRPETRQNRLSKTIDMLLNGKKIRRISRLRLLRGFRLLTQFSEHSPAPTLHNLNPLNYSGFIRAKCS